jgi:hypothetical protein
MSILVFIIKMSLQSHRTIVEAIQCNANLILLDHMLKKAKISPIEFELGEPPPKMKQSVQ